MLKHSIGHNFHKKDWKNAIGAYFLLLDYTDTSEMKKAVPKGLPWFQAKAQDNFLYLSDIIPLDAIEDPHDVELELKINGQVKQKDNTGNMYFKIPDQLEYICKHVTLHEGDILMTGTPEGMGPVAEGDKLEAFLSYKGKLLATIEDVIQKEK